MGCYLGSAASQQPVEADRAARRGPGLLVWAELLFHHLVPVGRLQDVITILRSTPPPKDGLILEEKAGVENGALTGFTV